MYHDILGAKEIRCVLVGEAKYQVYIGKKVSI